MDSWIERAWQTYRIGKRTTGISNLDLICSQGLLHGIRRIAMKIERIPPLQKPPIVIAGLPRTGTTFLQRFLNEQEIAKGQTLAEQLFPTPFLQKLTSPLLPILERISPARHHRPEIHTTGMQEIETDEACLFFQYLDGFFLYAFIWALDEEDHLPLFDIRNRDQTNRDFHWLKRCWESSTQNSPLPPLAKLFGLGACIPAFLRYFPHAKILYTARDPVDVIPSTLSLLLSVLRQRYDWDSVPQHRQRQYMKRIADALIELMYRFHCDWDSGDIDTSQCFLLPYTRLDMQFERTIRDIFEFLSYTPTPNQILAIQEQGMRQQKRKSSHRYRLEEYGLEEAYIREKTRFFTPYWSVENPL